LTLAALAAVPAIAAALAFGRTLACGFVFDDESAITDHDAILRGDWLAAAFGEHHTPIANRPISCLSFAIDHALFGLAPFGWHLGNVLLHAANAALAFLAVLGALRAERLGAERLGARWSEPIARSLAIATLWAVHPLCCDAVAYVTQRSTLWMTLFALAATVATLQSHASGRPRAWQATAVLCTALAMASKEEAVALPVLLILLQRAYSLPSWAALRRNWRFHAALLATWGVLLACVLAGPRNPTVGYATVPRASAWEWLLTQAPIVVHYVRLAFWPDALRGAYDFDVVRGAGEVLWPGLLVLGALAATGLAWPRSPRAAFLATAFFLLLAPTSSVLPIITELAAERRMYLPLLAVVAGTVCLAAQALGLAGAPSRARLASGAALVSCAIAGAAAATWSHVAVYRDESAFWRDAATKNELSNRGHMTGRILSSWGRVLHAAGDIPGAHAALERAMACASPTPAERLNFANLRREQRRSAEAEAILRGILRERPEYAEAMGNLADLLIEDPPPAGSPADAAARRFAEGEALLRRAVELAPRRPVLQNSMGVALFRRGDAAGAVPYLQRALDLDPSLAPARLNLGVALLDLGRPREALATWEPLLATLPHDPDLRVRLAAAHAAAGDRAAAETMLLAALAIAPGHPAATAMLADLRRDAASGR
jgi:tetratricopeptide (TPR) repeat protein